MKIPTLNAWVESPEKIADYMIACFYTSEYLQSTLSFGRIHSFPYLIKRHGQKPMDLQREARENLDELLSSVFSVKELDVVVEPIDDSNQLSIRVHCVLVLDGKERTLGQLVQFVDGRIRSIQQTL